jgi:hypothetical protein
MRGVRGENLAYRYLMSLVSLLSFQMPRLADYAFLAPWPWSLISDEFMKTTKKNYTSLGRLALDACALSAQSSRIWSKDGAFPRIVEEAKKAAGLWLGGHGVVPLQNCFEEYAKLFVIGFEIVAFKFGVKREELQRG